jgi:predicted small lipoprotein YifL
MLMLNRFADSTRVAVLIVSALWVLGMAGCGRKGPLFLPDDVTQPPAPTVPASK